MCCSWNWLDKAKIFYKSLFFSAPKRKKKSLGISHFGLLLMHGLISDLFSPSSPKYTNICKGFYRQVAAAAAAASSSQSVSHEDGCLPDTTPTPFFFFLTCCISFSSEESRLSLLTFALSISSSCLFFLHQHIYYLDFCHFVIFCFHAELEFIKKQIETRKYMKKGKYYLNWGLKNPEFRFFSRSLSLFLKGTCTLLLGQSCVLLPPLYLAMDLSYLFILSGQELNCSGFIWVIMLACNMWIHRHVWMEHVSNHVSKPVVRLLLPMHFICHHV